MSDLISRQAVLDAIEDDKRNRHYSCFASNNDAQCFKDVIRELPSVENKGEWIPLKTRPMTEEERTYYQEWAEYGAEIFDCPLPDDGQEVLVSWGGNVCVDTFVKDDGCYFEGVDIDDVDAWQPLPEPYKTESEE